MPGFDGTGPRGRGAMTGGGRGFCGPSAVRAARQPYRARRWAGCGYPYGAAPTREEERDLLKDEAQALKRNLERIEAKIGELGGDSTAT